MLYVQALVLAFAASQAWASQFVELLGEEAYVLAAEGFKLPSSDGCFWTLANLFHFLSRVLIPSAKKIGRRLAIGEFVRQF